MMGWTHCIFDLYGTLVDIHTDEDSLALWEKMAALYAERGAVYTPMELRAAYRSCVTTEEQGKRLLRKDIHEGHPEIQLEYVFQKLFSMKRVAVELSEAKKIGGEFRRASTEYIRLYPGAKELLVKLHKAGKKVWLLSNAQRIFTEPELQHLGIADMFDGIYISSDYGCKKPDSAFFEILLRDRSILSENAVMIGNDGICDIQGAKNAGLSTVYLRSNISPKEPMPEADYALPDVDYDALERILIS